MPLFFVTYSLQRTSHEVTSITSQKKYSVITLTRNGRCEEMPACIDTASVRSLYRSLALITLTRNGQCEEMPACIATAPARSACPAVAKLPELSLTIEISEIEVNYIETISKQLNANNHYLTFFFL